jgi:uncharacterized protein YacL
MNPVKSNFNVSQEFEIVPHQKGKAYPIGVKEWNYLKEKIQKIKIEVNIFHAVGFLLIGAAISCLVTIFATEFKNESSKYLTYSILGVTLIGGILSLIFANESHKKENRKPDEIINLMDLIESRFDNNDK